MRGLTIRGALTILIFVLAVLASGATQAEAHGNEVNIAVTCVAPDPGRPLTKACTAFLKYLDGEPVARANLQLTALREGKQEPAVGPLVFKPLDQEGVYSATVTFPAYGKWRMQFKVTEPGSGEAELTDDLLPPQPGATPELKAQLQVVFSFGLRDVRNVALRMIHLLAATVWFALSALVLVVSYLVPAEQRWRLLRRLSDAFPWAAGGSLLTLAVSGMLNGIYNAPTRPPGIFSPETIARLPFGEAYLAIIFIKTGLLIAILTATAALGLSLHRVYGIHPVPVPAGGTFVSRGIGYAPERHVMWLAALNLTFGLLAFAAVVMSGYFHIISHVAAAVGAR